MVTLQQLKNALKAILNSTDVKIKNVKASVIENLPKPSWTQNDETSKDFIEGRTHYEHITQEVIVEKQEIANNASTSTTLWGRGELTICVDDEKYKCTQKNQQVGQSTYGWYGNGNILNNKLPDTGEPFVYCGYYKFKDGKSHTIEILGTEIITYKTLDEKFIPDTIARKSDITEIIEELDSVRDEVIALKNLYINGGV